MDFIKTPFPKDEATLDFIKTPFPKDEATLDYINTSLQVVVATKHFAKTAFPEVEIFIPFIQTITQGPTSSYALPDLKISIRRWLKLEPDAPEALYLAVLYKSKR